MEYASDSWVTRFLRRNHDSVILECSTGVDANRHLADSYEKYRLHFELLHGKMSEYRVLPENTYNMRDNGFMIGVIKRSKECSQSVNICDGFSHVVSNKSTMQVNRKTSYFCMQDKKPLLPRGHPRAGT
jgi:hypothetical protein